MSSINPISSASVPLVSMPSTPPTDPNDPTKAAGSTTSFSDMVGGAINSLEQTQSNADVVSMQAATGQLSDVHDLTIATTEATLATELTVAIRNKALEAFTQIMQMPV